MKKRILVIGASGVVGQAAIAAVRQAYGNDAHIVATATEYKALAGANEIEIIKLTAENIADRSWLEPLLAYRPFDVTFFTPAYAKAVGMPEEKVTENDKTEAYNFCVKPLMQLEDSGNFGVLVAFSGFLNLPLVRQVYGAMIYSKHELENFCAGDISRRQLFRLGAFESRSLRGLAAQILSYWRGKLHEMYRLFTLAKNPESKKLSQALLEQILAEESDSFGSTKPTTPGRIQSYLADWLVKQNQGFHNLVGDIKWVGRTLRPVFSSTEEARQLKMLTELHRAFCDPSGGLVI